MAFTRVVRRGVCAMCDVQASPEMSPRPFDAEDPDSGALHRCGVHVAHTFVDLYVAFVTFALYLFTFETLLLCVLSVGSVTFFTHWYTYHDERLSANINWTFFSFAVVFPLTFSLNEAFKRRELALAQLAQMKSNVLNIYMAHRDWNWATKEHPAGGRYALPSGHADAVRTVLTELLSAQQDVLLAPNVGRSRHFLTERGQKKRSRVQQYKAERHVHITLAVTRLSAAVEELKTAGLPGNEAARLRQYSQLLMGQWEMVRNVKRYRTPLTTRCYGRLANLLHPFIMGPYYAYIGGFGVAEGRERTNYAFAVMLSVFTSIALSSLFNIRYALEDPFCEGSLDTVRVRKDFAEMQRMLRLRATGGPLFDDGFEQPERQSTGVLQVELSSLS